MPSALQRMHAPVEARSVDRENLTVDIVASTFALDTYKTRFDQAGWVMERFLSNPVITWAHDDRGFTPAGGLPVANAIPGSVRVVDGRLEMRLRFTPKDVNEFGYKVFRMIAEGFLHGLSVGFDPKAWEDKEEVVDGKRVLVRVFTRIELQEVAVVTIPSNAEALVKRAVERNLDPDEARRLAEEVERNALEQARAIDPEEFDKYRSYFERKQPANKASTAVLKKFFEARGERQPDDEVEAWNRMGELLEETPAPEEKAEEPTPVPEEEVEAKPAEVIPEPEKVEEEPITPPPAEAPQTPDRKASVSISLSVLKALPGAVLDAAEDAAAKASRRGVPAHRLGEVVTQELGQLIISTLSHPHP